MRQSLHFLFRQSGTSQLKLSLSRKDAFFFVPIAAAMAVASGAMQVTTIKKQQQESQAQGYGEGGFTRKGIKQAQDEYQRLMKQ